jgi:hypothetical protein
VVEDGEEGRGCGSRVRFGKGTSSCVTPLRFWS